MADWIIPCNPEFFDVFGAFEKLGSVDWTQSAPGIEKGDMVFIYVARPVQAVALRCIATEVMIPGDQADHSDAEFEKGDSSETDSHYYMRLKLDKWIPPGMITFEKMQKAGMKGNIQGPRRVPGELRELFGLDAIRKDTASESVSSVPEKSAVKYDVDRFIRDLKAKEEIDPDTHDGSYWMMWETVQAYANLQDLSALDYHDLNLVYLTSVGTWKHGIDAKKKTIDESHLDPSDKKYLKELWDEVWRMAGEGAYSNSDPFVNGNQSIGMFGTGFMSFQGKTTSESVRQFIAMCIDLLPMEDDDEMFDRAAQVLNDSFKGMQAASVSMVLHCLKPCTFPIMNTNMGYGNIFGLLGVRVTNCYYQKAYIENCRKIKAFRDRNFTFRNYRIFDKAARDVDKYRIEPVSDSADTLKKVETAGEKEEKGSVETQVNERVREEFMRQIRDKKAALADLDLKRENILREISLLEEMLSKI